MWLNDMIQDGPITSEQVHILFRRLAMAQNVFDEREADTYRQGARVDDDIGIRREIDSLEFFQNGSPTHNSAVRSKHVHIEHAGMLDTRREEVEI